MNEKHRAQLPKSPIIDIKGTKEEIGALRNLTANVRDDYNATVFLFNHQTISEEQFKTKVTKAKSITLRDIQEKSEIHHLGMDTLKIKRVIKADTK